MRVNQRGEEVDGHQVFYVGDDFHSSTEQSDAIALLCEHLGIEIWSTNATKHGDRQLVLRKKEDL